MARRLTDAIFLQYIAGASGISTVEATWNMARRTKAAPRINRPPPEAATKKPLAALSAEGNLPTSQKKKRH